MLPPDTSSLLPWRVMVPLMQISGCFPYKMSAKSGQPVFSLSLSLWGLFLTVFLLSSYCLAYQELTKLYLTPAVGSIVFLCSTGVTYTIVSIVPLLLGMKSSSLAALLHEMSQVKTVVPPPTQRWYCRTKTLASVSMIVFLTGFMTYFVSTTWKIENVFEVVCIYFAFSFYHIVLFLPSQLSSMVFELLARRLVAATEATVDKVSMLLAPDGSFKCESDVKETMLELRNLECVIGKVEVQRETGARCFFPVASLFLLKSVLLAIVCPYTILTGIVVGGSTVIMLVTAYCVIFSFSHIGQAFINEVTVAETLLKDLRARSDNHLLTTKVTQVMGRLSSMLTFNMCGWYRLDYTNFLVLINTVQTYVAIIFQVGGNDVQSLLSTPTQQTNSSAPQ